MQYITKRIDKSYVAWFEQSNQWIQLEEPAWYVNKLYQKGLDNYTISLKCAKKYKLDISDCLRFVISINEGLKECYKPLANNFKNNIIPDYTKYVDMNKFSTRYYIIGGKRLSIIYYSRQAEYYIHEPLAHLETSRFIGVADEQFEILSHDGCQVLLKNGNQDINCVFDDFIKLKKHLFIEIANIIYDKSSNDWISFIHASALTDGKQTLLLSSPSGSGKSTMAALMQTRGFQIVSDDFVPIDARLKCAYPFPAAISVKHGAFPLLTSYYNQLQDDSYNGYIYANKSIRYVYPKINSHVEMVGKPVKTIVFIHYNPHKKCKIKKIPLLEALKLYHEQSWVSSDPEHVKTFLKWFVKLNFYNLEFGDTAKGMDKISAIFNNNLKD